MAFENNCVAMRIDLQQAMKAMQWTTADQKNILWKSIKEWLKKQVWAARLLRRRLKASWKQDVACMKSGQTLLVPFVPTTPASAPLTDTLSYTEETISDKYSLVWKGKDKCC